MSVRDPSTSPVVPAPAAPIVTAVASIAALKALAGTDITGTVEVLSRIASAIPDGLGGVYTWNSTDTRSDDSATLFTIIQPDSGGVGRWNQVTTGSFLQSGTGAVARPVQSKEREWVSIEDFGAVGDGVTDDAAAVVLALATNREIHLSDIGNYKLNSMVALPKNARIFGKYSFANDAQLPRFTLAAGITGFQTPSTSASSENLGVTLEGFVVSSGTIGVDVRNGGVGFVQKDMLYLSQSDKGVQTKGFNQEWFWHNVEFNGGNYGFYCDNAAGSGGTSSLLDKCTFNNVYAHGQQINGVRIKVAASNNVTWNDTKLINIVQDGFTLDGGTAQWVINNLNSEVAGGYTGSAPTSPTTGTINAASPTLTVASATGLAIGQTLTVAGAGTSGQDLTSLIDNLAGTTVTLHDNASTSVVSAEVVNYLYSTLKIAQTVTTPRGIVVIGGNFGFTSGTGNPRYAIDASGCRSMIIIGSKIPNRPVYDPFNSVHVIGRGDEPVVLRRPPNFLSEDFSSFVIGASTHHGVIPSPLGGPMVIGLRDSVGNGSGTFTTNFEGRKSDSNRTRAFYCDAAKDGVWSGSGGISPGGYLAGTGAIGTLSESNLRIVYGNAIPTAGTWARGEIVKNQTPTVGQPKGWVCTVAGTPGTWVSEGNL